MSISDASVLALTVGFPNSAAVTLPLLTTAYGPSSTVIAAPSIAVGIVFGKSFNSTPETASSALIASYCVGAFSLAGWMLVITNHF